MLSALVLGPTPVPEAVARVEEILERAQPLPRLRGYGAPGARDVSSDGGAPRRGARAPRGQPRHDSRCGPPHERGRERPAVRLRRAPSGGSWRWSSGSRRCFATASRSSSESEIGHSMPTVALELASCLVRQERDDEARALLRPGPRANAPRGHRQLRLPRRDRGRARTLGREGSRRRSSCARRSLDARRDDRLLRPARHARTATLAEVLALGGKRDEAAEVAAAALALHDAKGDVAGVAALREQFAQAGIEVGRA